MGKIWKSVRWRGLSEGPKESEKIFCMIGPMITLSKCMYIKKSLLFEKIFLYSLKKIGKGGDQ